ncbi:hypothetical protein [Shewanella sp. GXUN23E]|uniref:hypothetical protein n=1 Tax=Shewanella sp. GXUN23E TaxID=3422498 RepID=UPI003D7CE619
MDILAGGGEFDVTRVAILEHQFDLNRIVRIVDTCCRVVNPATCTTLILNCPAIRFLW